MQRQIESYPKWELAMTPRERQENARRAARRGPIYEAIGFAFLVLVASLIAGPIGFLFMLLVGAAMLLLGLVVGILRGPENPSKRRDRLPPV